MFANDSPTPATVSLPSNSHRSCQELTVWPNGHFRSLAADDYHFLEKRLGRLHAKLRLGIEADHEAQVFGQGINYFHIENLRSSHLLIRACLKLTGLYWRGQRNAAQIEVRHHYIASFQIPKPFDGYTILHLSDLHVDMSRDAMARLTAILREISYDLCVLTGDYRGQTFGPYQAALIGMSRICTELKKPAYGVLGNHDTVCMLRGLEEMGIRMLLNEHEQIKRDGECIHLAGIDDAHFYRADNIEKAASEIPTDEFSILLSHTPEIYREAALADFKLLLSGHTHGGQICLPGQIPVTLGSVLPRHMGAGPWRHRDMIGYTSVGAGSSIVPVRFNCPPEITLHHLQASE
jgi:predicted MPP superfamily phosphohydrolase